MLITQDEAVSLHLNPWADAAVPIVAIFRSPDGTVSARQFGRIEIDDRGLAIAHHNGRAAGYFMVSLASATRWEWFDAGDIQEFIGMLGSKEELSGVPLLAVELHNHGHLILLEPARLGG